LKAPAIARGRSFLYPCYPRKGRQGFSSIFDRYLDKFVKSGTMKTIDLDLEKDQKLENLTNYLRDKKIKLGEEAFQLKIYSYADMTQILYASFLLLLVVYFIVEKKKKESEINPDITGYDKESKTYYQIYLKNYDVNKLESKIEKDFNVDIELEKKNPLDDVFGIWKNESIDLGKIRAKAWQRPK
jgi:hypothetical protein